MVGVGVDHVAGDDVDRILHRVFRRTSPLFDGVGGGDDGIVVVVVEVVDVVVVGGGGGASAS